MGRRRNLFWKQSGIAFVVLLIIIQEKLGNHHILCQMIHFMEKEIITTIMKQVCKTICLALMLVFLLSHHALAAPTIAEQADSLMYLADDARYYRLEEKSHRGHTVIADFTEIAKNEFRIAVAQFCPNEGYTVNDGILKFHLTINEEKNVIAPYVMYIDALEGAYVVFYGTVHFEDEITSLRLVPEWGHGIKQEDTMYIPVNLTVK